MNLFYALLGLLLGGNIAFHSDILSLILLALTSVFFFCLSFSRGRARPFLIAFSASLAFFLLYRFLPRFDDGVTSFKGIITQCGDNYVIILSLRGKYYVNAYGHSFERFDVIEISGEAQDLCKANYEMAFDFEDYLRRAGVIGEIKPSKVVALLEFPLRIRSFANAFLSRYGSKTKQVILPLLFGRKDSSSFFDFGQEIGAGYALSASGIFYMAIIRPGKRVASSYLEEKEASWIGMLIASLLLPFYGGKSGILRAFFMMAIRHIALLKKKEIAYLDALSLSAFALLLFRPFAFDDSGFLLGLGICVGLFYGRPLMKRLPKKLRKAGPLILIRLLILPLSISGGKFALLGLFYTLLLTPFSYVATFLGLTSAFLSLPSALLDGYCSFFLDMVEFFSKRNVLVYLPFDGVMVYFVYYALFAICFFLTEIGLQRWRNHILSIGFLSYAISCIPFRYLCLAQVSFINVGQGDAILIAYRDKTVMIDTGGINGIDMAHDTLIPFLYKERIYHIDCLIATHNHFDHMGAAKDLLGSFSVGRYVTDKEDFPLSIGGITLTNYNVYDRDDENEKSLFLYMELLGKKWLFTGDAGTITEKAIIKDHPELDCDILKVGHHGSEGSSCLEFLNTVTPEVAIISCGRANSHGHPREEALSRLRICGAKIRRTDLEGTITYRGLAF